MKRTTRTKQQPITYRQWLKKKNQYRSRRAVFQQSAIVGWERGRGKTMGKICRATLAMQKISSKRVDCARHRHRKSCTLLREVCSQREFIYKFNKDNKQTQFAHGPATQHQVGLFQQFFLSPKKNRGTAFNARGEGGQALALAVSWKCIIPSTQNHIHHNRRGKADLFPHNLLFDH